MDKITVAENKRRVQLNDMRARLAELEDTLHAIRSGEVDALIVNGPNGDQVYSLKGAEQPYRDFIEEMQEGAITLDPTGTILYCNRSFAKMLDTPLERVISSKLADRISPDHRLLVDSMLADAGAATANVVLFVNGGKHLSVRLAVNPLTTDARGEAVARCLVVTDLTEQHERKFLTEALHRLQTSQEDLQKQYLEVQAVRAKLEQANAAKDEFLAALSHELRTPLTPVLLTANAMAVDPSLPAELRGDLEMIRRNVELEARLIDDLLDLTRITTGKLKINATSIDLHDILRLALDICQSDTAAKRLRFAIHFDATYHYVSAEAVRLQQVFWNLIRNAVKFTPGSGQITVSTKNAKKGSKDATPAILITVSDTGMGIAPESLGRIFNAFEQGSSEITRRFGGLGLGLTITSRIIDLHGGKITAASKGAGQGSTFTITLPTVPTPSRSAPAPAANKPATAQSLRILLVEDHDDTRRNMTRLLTALNHTVVPAHDAASALARAAEETFDLVVSDIGLPDESGLELMKKLKAHHKLRGICLSGYGMEEDVAKSLAAGFLEHLTKPINFQRLETAINKAASAAPSPAPTPSRSRNKN
jgi:PAS domain S-box-containing protein